MFHTYSLREEERWMQQQPKSPRERAVDLMSLLLGWRPTPQQGVWGLRLAVVLVVLVAIGRAYDITLLDWLKLLIVPAVIAGGGIWFNRQQRERELRIAQEQREQDAKIAESRTQDETLQAYLDQMSDMLVPTNDQPSLYTAQPGDSLSYVARARTLTVLPRLDGVRKARVVQFLYESGLIHRDRAVLDLRGAYLRGADLIGSDLSRADLSGANLSGANLSGANLSGANLSNATLSRADLSGATLYGADLSGITDLSGANLSNANLRQADLSGANLRKANLRGADLSNANLRQATLSNATLSGADLRQADLTGALGFTNEELERQANYLEGATMPNVQRYEDWKKSRGEQNSGS
jgi:uncharacterized protein YjbI with pentapeptide repeats